MTTYIIGAARALWNFLVSVEREAAHEILAEFNSIADRLEAARDAAVHEAQEIAVKVEQLNAVAVAKATEAELADAVAGKIRGLVSK
jgi:hypothetical protein